MDKPLISVIVPIYNVEKYLDRCVQSIVDQTYKELEIILIDDGSPDNSPEICDGWAKKDGRIKVIHKKNGGVSSARNAGLDAARGEYVGFVDGDDIILPEFYETLITNAQNNAADISCCFFTYYNEDYSIYKQTDGCYDSEKKITPKELLNAFFSSCKGEWVSLCNKIIKTELFDGLRFPNGRVFEDWTLAPMLYSKAKMFFYTPEKLYGYVIHAGSAVRTQDIKTFRDCVAADYDHYNYFNSRKINEYNSFIKNYAKSDFRKCIKSFSCDKKGAALLEDAYNMANTIGALGKAEKLMYRFPAAFKLVYGLKR